MRSDLISTLIAATVAVVAFSCSQKHESPQTGVRGEHAPAPAADEDTTLITTQVGLRMEVPNDWQSEPPTSSMRQAQFILPAAEGDSDPATMVVYYFGQDSGGSVEDNMRRWASQFSVEPNQDAMSMADIDKEELGQYICHRFDLTGRYVAETSPGSGVRVDKADYRQIAYIVETPAGNFFLRAVGPTGSIAAQAERFRSVVAGLTLAP